MKSADADAKPQVLFEHDRSSLFLIVAVLMGVTFIGRTISTGKAPSATLLSLAPVIGAVLVLELLLPLRILTTLLGDEVTITTKSFFTPPKKTVLERSSVREVRLAGGFFVRSVELVPQSGAPVKIWSQYRSRWGSAFPRDDASRIAAQLGVPLK